jgi:hypothetical protein
MIGIDLVSLGVFLVAFVVGQIRSIPLRIRYGVFSASCGLIAILRLRRGAAQMNLIFVGIALAAALYYAVRAARAGPR